MGKRRVAERRREPRAHATGTVVIHRARSVAKGRINDLSTRGLALELLRDEDGDGFDVGAPVEIDLHLDGARHRWLQVAGTVCRRDGLALAVRLGDTPDELADLVQDQLVSALECCATPYVVLVDDDPARRARTAHRLRASGCLVREAHAPLEVIAHLDDSGVHPCVVAIAETLPAGSAEQLRAVLAQWHPHTRITILDEGGSTAASGGAASAEAPWRRP